VTTLGRVRALARYPVKSMAGIPLESAVLGWHGLEGDRRFAWRRVGERSGMPWLTASRLPELLLYHPEGIVESGNEPLPTHVRTPAGARPELRSPELEAEIGGRLGTAVELMHLGHGIFDETAVSVITAATISGIGREAGRDLDPRRFRANVVVETEEGGTFLEDAWIGGTLLFGEGEPRPAVRVIRRDLRCMMINLDPDTAEQDPRVMKTVVRLSDNHAGVYGTVAQVGTIRVGDRVTLAR
jgi:uncharacterized protein YcbX